MKEVIFIKDNENVKVRKIIDEDKDNLRKIFLEIRQEEFSWVDNTVAKLTDFDSSTEGELIFTAIVNNQVAGFISIWEEDNFIHNLFVSKSFRRFGIGKALLNKAIETVGTPLTLKCMKENSNAKKFYLSNNWKIEKEDVSFEGPYYLMSYCK